MTITDFLTYLVGGGALVAASWILGQIPEAVMVILGTNHHIDNKRVINRVKSRAPVERLESIHSSWLYRRLYWHTQWNQRYSTNSIRIPSRRAREGVRLVLQHF